MAAIPPGISAVKQQKDGHWPGLLRERLPGRAHSHIAAAVRTQIRLRLAAQRRRKRAIAVVEHRALKNKSAPVKDETQAPAGEEERQPMTAQIIADPALVTAGDPPLAHMRGNQSGVDTQPGADRRSVHLNDAVSDIDPLRRRWLLWRHPLIPIALLSGSLNYRPAGDQGRAVVFRRNSGWKPRTATTFVGSVVPSSVGTTAKPLQILRHSRASGSPVFFEKTWMPACAGMTQ
jgi:hypothetical protein